MLKQPHAPEGVLIIMDAGIASENNLEWLILNKYNYLLVIRERKRDVDIEKASVIESSGGHQIHLQRQPGQHKEEIKIPCWSEQRAMKDRSINTSF